MDLAAFSSRLDWGTVALSLLSAAVTSAVIARVFRASAGDAQRADGDAIVLHYAPILKWVLILASLLFAVLYALTMMLDPPSGWEPPRAQWVVLAIYAPLCAMGLAGCLEVFTVRIEVSPIGIAGRCPWRGRRALAWSEVSRVTFSPAMMWFVVEGRDGTAIRVSKLLRGIPALGHAVRTHLPAPLYSDASVYFDTPVGEERAGSKRGIRRP